MSARFGWFSGRFCSAVLAAAFPDVGIGLLAVSREFGLTVLIMAYAVGGIWGGPVNPACSTGVALFADGPARSQWWLFWVAPLVGAAIGALIWKAVLTEE